MAQKKARRAVRAASKDVAALERLAGRHPLAAVDPCIAQLTATPDASVLRVAEGLVERLRVQGNPAEALRVAQAVGQPTARLRLGAALCAFSSGDDTLAAEICATDTVSARVVGPLLGGAVSVPSGARRGKGQGPRVSETTAARTLRVMAAAVAEFEAGDELSAARRLTRLPKRAGGRLPTQALAQALELARSTRAGQPEALTTEEADGMAYSVVASLKNGPKEALSTFILEAAPSPVLANAVAEVCRHQRVSGHATALAERAALQGLRELHSGTAAQRVLKAPPGSFDSGSLGAARLHEGFALIVNKSPEAKKRFEQALTAGADQVEALRGWRIACALELELQMSKPAGPSRSSCEEYAAVSERLLAGARRGSGGNDAIALAISLDTASQLVMAGSAGSALASRWIAQARGLMPQGAEAPGAEASAVELLNQLDIAEAQLARAREPDRAIELVDRVLVRTPSHLPAWLLKIAAARDAGGPVEEWIEAAARATQDPTLQNAARQLQIRRGTVAPFESLVPGAAPAGMIVGEVIRCMGQSVKPGSKAAEASLLAAMSAAERFVAALDDSEREAYLAGLIAIAACHLGGSGLARVLESLPQHTTDFNVLHRLASLTMELSEGDLRPALREIAERRRRGYEPLIVALIAAASSELGATASGKLLGGVAASLDRSTLDRARHASMTDEPAYADEVIETYHDLLEPHVCLLALMEEWPGHGRSATAERSAATEQPVAASDSITLFEVLDSFGIPLSALNALSIEEMRELKQSVAEVVAEDFSEEGALALLAILDSYGIAPPSWTRTSYAPKMKKRTTSERNRRKQARRKDKRR